MDPFQTSLSLPCILNNSLLNWRLKFMEMTECLQNCRFYGTIISDYSSEVKLSKSKDFLLMTYVEKRHILRLLRPVILLLTRTLTIYHKMVRIYSYLFCNLKILCSRTVQIFICVSWGVLISSRPGCYVQWIENLKSHDSKELSIWCTYLIVSI